MSGWEGETDTETSSLPLTFSSLKYIALSEPDMSAVLSFYSRGRTVRLCCAASRPSADSLCREYDTPLTTLQPHFLDDLT
jgi:hypothetical protein